jgi:Skp family chaperone for outer membrane proteins
MEVRLRADRDMQKDLEAVKEDLSKLRSDIADLTQKLLDMGKSEAGSARYRIETEARNLGRELRQTLNETGEHGRKTVESME